MNRRRFGRISLLVTATLAVLLAVQAWSLASMYRDRREEFSRQVMQAMTRAAYDDLLLGNKPTERKSLVTFSSSGKHRFDPRGYDSGDFGEESRRIGKESLIYA